MIPSITLGFAQPRSTTYRVNGACPFQSRPDIGRNRGVKPYARVDIDAGIGTGWNAGVSVDACADFI